MAFSTKLNVNKRELLKLAEQFIKFGIVGVANTLIALLTYYILVYFKFNYIIANTIGFIVSVINAYYWNNKFVFKKSDSNNVKTIIKTFIAYGTTFLISTVLLIAMVDYLGISKIVAPIINLIITIPLNFLLNKFWTFK
ncbi:MAG: putative flippase GtrA [Clostridium sp.]|jgi:putative flippase GtrA